MQKYAEYYQFFKHICTLVETLNNFECHHLQNDFYHEDNLNQILGNLPSISAILAYILLILAFSIIALQ